MALALSYEKFKLVPSAIGKVLLLNELEMNMKMYADWAFLQMGNWFDVDYAPGSGTNTVRPRHASPARLRLVSDNSYTDGQVWEGARKDWCWETSVDYVSPIDSATYNPNTVNIYVDDVLQSASNYTINYQLGRVIFTTALATTSTVYAQHAHRWIQTYTMAQAEWFRELQFASFEGDNSHFLQEDSTGGGWSIGSHRRIQMPSIIVESVPRGMSRGYELGNSALVVFQDMLFHIVAEDSYMRNNMLDVLRLQKDKTIYLFDSNKIADSGAWPLAIDGDIANANVYPTLVAESGYRWKKCTFADAVLSEVEAVHPSLYEGTVRMTLEIVMGSI